VDWLDILLDVLVGLHVVEVFKTPIIEDCLTLLSFFSILLSKQQCKSGLSAVLRLVIGNSNVLEAVKLSLFFHLHLVLAVVINIKNVDDGVCTSHKVWVVGVDVSILNFNKVSNHRVGWLQLFVKQGIHHLHYLFTQILES
jgi:hypothetical protein